MSLNLPLIALAAGAFGIGTTEFAPMGLLPVIAADLHISIPTAGLLVTGYALGVLVGAPLLTLSTERVPRKWLLLGLMALFTLGNLLSALSPNYRATDCAGRDLALPRRFLRRRLCGRRKPRCARPTRKRGLNRTEFSGGGLAWVTRPKIRSPHARGSGIPPRPVGCFRSAQAGGGC